MTIKLPQKDIDELNQKWQKWQQTVRADVSKWETQTLKQHILHGAELVKLRIDFGLLDISEDGISSFLFKELIKEGVQVDDSYIRKVLPDNFKRNYSNSGQYPDLVESKWKLISDGDNLIEKDQLGNFRIDGKIQRDIPEPKGVTEDFNSSDEIHEKIRNQKQLLSEKYPELKTIAKIILASELQFENLKEIRNKFEISVSQSSDKVDDKQKEAIKKIFDEYFTSERKASLDKFADDQIIEETNDKNNLDWRLRVGRFEKIMAKLNMINDQFIHEVAKKLHCSAKHLKNDVLNVDTVEKDYAKFRKCPSCSVDIAETFNKKLEEIDLRDQGVIA